MWAVAGVLGSAGSVFGLAGCGGSEAAHGEPETHASAPPEVGQQTAEVAEAEAPEARSEWEDPTYRLAAQTGSYTPGSEGHFQIVLEPRGDYHVNQEYPLRVELSGPAAIAFPSEVLTVEDATEFGEPRARFEVSFTPEAEGQHEILADVNFAVCTPEACMPESRRLALVLDVHAPADSAEDEAAREETATP